MPITQSENDPMHKADENMVWFASYRDCRCTFVGDSLQAVPATCSHGSKVLDKPEYTRNPLNVAHGLETREQTAAR